MSIAPVKQIGRLVKIEELMEGKMVLLRAAGTQEIFKAVR